MKKLLTLGLISVLTLAVMTGCGGSQKNEQPAAESTAAEATAEAGESAADTTPSGELKKIVVGATPSPHAEILEAAKPLLKEKGYDLEIQEFTDYVLPNNALENKELDANYFQHQPYLDDFNKNNNTHLVSAGAIHYEPLGLYAGKSKSLDDLKDGAQIGVPNDTSNEARALLLLQDQGLIKLKDGAGLEATAKDIAENPHNIKIQELQAEQITRALPDLDYAVINGNYALQGGLNVNDALAKEESDSVAAQTYANIVAVREGDETREDIKALVEVLQSKEIADFINQKYQGSVVSMTQAQ